MRIEVDFLLEDLEELYIPETYAADPARYRRKMRSGFIGWIVSVIVLTGLYLFGTYARSSSYIPQYGNPRREFQLDLITLVLPGALAILFTAIAFFKLWRNSIWRPKAPVSSTQQKQKAQGRIFGLILALIAFAVTVVSFMPELVTDWRPSRGQIILLCWAPWLGVLLTSIALTPLLMHWQARRTWLNNSAFKRHHVYELDDWGLKAQEPEGRFEKSWSTFTRARETKNLLVLVHESNLQYLIPKRAFPSESDLESARALLQNKLQNTTFLAKPLGFPITPGVVSAQS